MIDTILAKGFTLFAQFMVTIQPIWNKYKILISVVFGLLLGLFLGLMMGYVVAPVEWINASPGHLRGDYQAYYLSYVAEEYERTQDPALAYRRLFGTVNDLDPKYNVPWVGDDMPRFEAFLTDLLVSESDPNVDAAKLQLIEGYRKAVLTKDGPVVPMVNSTALDKFKMGIEVIKAQEPVVEPPPANNLVLFAGLFLLLLVVGGGAAVWFFLLRPKPQSLEGAGGDSGYSITEGGGDVAVGEGAPPVKSFNTPYVLGDDYFDPSFSIEVGADFLGECGIGISETIGAGDPKKVTAFEAWLFDKSDIRTVTTVMASEYAFNDPDLRSKLEPKGDVVMLHPGLEVALETSALRVKARVKDLEYAQGNFPPNSFVQKINFELQAWVKQVESSGLGEDVIV